MKYLVRSGGRRERQFVMMMMMVMTPGITINYDEVIGDTSGIGL